MEIGLCIWNLKNKALFIIFFLVLFGCENTKKQQSVQINVNQDKLTNAVLVCRLGNGFFSSYFKRYASKEQKYSHIGIISIENDTTFVYHSEASELTGVGFVKKETLNQFLKGIKVYDFFQFNYSDSIKNKILDNVKNYYLKKVSFDLDFDSFDDNKVYCAELIAISINKVFDTIQIKPNIILNDKKLYGLDDIYLNENVYKISSVCDTIK